MEARLRVVLVFIVITILVASGCKTKASSNNRPIDEPILAVLCIGDRSIYCMNAKSLNVDHKVKLRSLCLDFTKGEGSTVYTSQCGLAGPGADNAIGIVDIRTGVVNRYVELRQPNPGEIAFERDKLVVINGIMLENGNLVGEVLQTKKGFKSNPFEILGVTYGPSLAINKGALFVSTLIEEGNRAKGLERMPTRAFISMDLTTKRVSRLFSDLYFSSIVFDHKDVGYGLISRPRNDSSVTDKIVIFNPKDKNIIETFSLQRQSMPAKSVIWHDDKLYINFFNDESLDYTGDSVAIVDLKTRKTRVINGFKGPSALVPVNGKLYVANYDSGTVDIVEESTGRRLDSVKVGKWPFDLAFAGD